MELSLDTASELATIALSDDGSLVAEMTWRCHRNHTVELLPSVETLLAQVHVDKAGLAAVFVCVGPGMYTGLRVGVTVAKGLAHGLGVPAVGVGRLELDAYPHASFPGEIVAVHRAGRGELAWASYRGDPWRETNEPQLAKPDALAARIDGPTLFTGEVDDTLCDAIGDRAKIASPSASVRRAGALAELGHERLTAGAAVDAALIKPVYLRPPAIGPQG